MRHIFTQTLGFILCSWADFNASEVTIKCRLKKKVNLGVCEREITLSLFFLLKKHIFCNTFPSLATYIFPICIIYLYKEREGGTFVCLFGAVHLLILLTVLKSQTGYSDPTKAGQCRTLSLRF